MQENELGMDNLPCTYRLDPAGHAWLGGRGLVSRLAGVCLPRRAGGLLGKRPGVWLDPSPQWAGRDNSDQALHFCAFRWPVACELT